MKKKYLYSKSSLNLIRISAIVSIILIIVSNIIRISKFLSGIYENSVYLFYTSIIINFLVLIFSFILLFLPTKLLFISISSLLYSGLIFVFDIKNPLGIFLFILSVVVSMCRGFFIHHKKIKIIITILIFIAFLLSELSFGYKLFFEFLLKKIVLSFVLFLIILFLHIYSKNVETKEKSNKQLNLFEFEKLDSRDARWLTLIQKGEKYDNIAKEYNLSSGSVKNRLNIIYKTLKVGDRKGFLNKFSDYEIIYSKI